MLASQSADVTNSMLAAAWVTAGATVGLFIGAVVTAFFALTAWMTQLGGLATQFMELGVLARQAQSDLHLRRRAQAAQVFIWLDKAGPTTGLDSSQTVAYVTNSSQQPVYDVEITLPVGKESVAHLMPGTQHTFQDIGTQVVDGTSTVSCSFRDAAGLGWLTTSRGGLTELTEPDAEARDAEAPDAEAPVSDESAGEVGSPAIPSGKSWLRRRRD